MKNFIFKSESDFHKMVFKKLENLLAEQRQQRMDLGQLLNLANRKLGYYNKPEKTLEEYDTSPQEPDEP